MVDDNQSAESLRRLSRERFQEEVARELGIDLDMDQKPRRDGQELQASRNDVNNPNSEN
jgi:hypothetical protein